MDLIDKNKPSGGKTKDEYFEAEQARIDKQRYAMVENMLPEEKERFFAIENIVRQLESMSGTPFMLLASPTSKKGFIRYQKFTEEEFPLSEEAGKQFAIAAYNAFLILADFYAKTTGMSITLKTAEGVPVTHVTKDEILKLYVQKDS
jgi:hypothetical protein